MTQATYRYINRLTVHVMPAQVYGRARVVATFAVLSRLSHGISLTRLATLLLVTNRNSAMWDTHTNIYSYIIAALWYGRSAAICYRETAVTMSECATSEANVYGKVRDALWVRMHTHIHTAITLVHAFREYVPCMVSGVPKRNGAPK